MISMAPEEYEKMTYEAHNAVKEYTWENYVKCFLEDLEDYGIIRGQSAPIDKTSPEYIKEQLKALISRLPSEMQRDYKDLVMPTEQEEKLQYQKQIENARRMNFIQRKEMGLCTKQELEESEMGGSMYEDDQENIHEFISQRAYESNPYGGAYNGNQSSDDPFGGSNSSGGGNLDWWDD